MPAILSIPPAIDFVSENFSRFARHIKTLSDAIKEELKKEQSVTLYSSFPSLDGIIAFNIGNLDSNFVASTLYEKFGVCVRGGYHCAPLTHRELGTKERGAVRISLGCDNTEQEVADFLLAVKEIASSLR